jgi:RNA polymerase-interacting CarD/CdnL/TRCF family regulator
MEQRLYKCCCEYLFMKFRNLGILLLLVSIGLSSSNFVFTGAVIGVEVYSFLNVLAIVFFILGVVVVFTSWTLEERAKLDKNFTMAPEQIYARLNREFPENNKVLVADTSFISRYLDHLEFLGFMKENARLIIPEQVLEEVGRIKGAESRVDFLRKSSDLSDVDYKKYLDVAQDVLKKGRKHLDYTLLEPIILGKVSEHELDIEDKKVYDEAVKNLKRELDLAGLPDTKSTRRRHIETHWKMSETDAVVLAHAIAEKQKGRTPIILERDSDFEDAIKYMGGKGVNGVYYLNSKGKSNSR